MRTLSLALRNLLRNRRRSLTTLSAMVIGAVTILVFGGYSRNITLSLQTSYVMRGGHLQIQRKDYFLYGSGNPAAYGIADYQHVIDVVARDPVLAPMLAVVTQTISLGGIAGNFAAGVSRTIIGAGLVVADRNRMRRWNDFDLSINLPPSALTGTAEDAVVIGNGVARVLELCEPLKVANCPGHTKTEAAAGVAAPDDVTALSALEARPAAAPGEARIELLAANVHGAPNVASLRVVKAERQGFKEFDDMFVGMHLAQAQRLLYGAEKPQATAVVLQLAHTSQIPAAKARLAELLTTTLKREPLEVQDFEALNPFYGQAVGMFAAIFGFMAALIGAIVLFTVGNTMSMAVIERTAEIGTLRAMGLRRSGIRRLFMSEALLLGVIGAVAGVAAALCVAWLVNHAGLTWLPPGQVDPVPLTVRVWGETKMMLGTAAGLALVAVVSAWWPARRAARMLIVDALRHV
ncbi:MAG: ABC transporter permease [Betaproteobacteria bacterium RIFCSPLOWO2_12_FULL_65_14]|nr:MAG: ABC transporter permease [Betaproteobacteria bacterium RIFCSPLOWO2_12_FULL_65_14]